MEIQALGTTPGEKGTAISTRTRSSFFAIKATTSETVSILSGVWKQRSGVTLHLSVKVILDILFCLLYKYLLMQWLAHLSLFVKVGPISQQVLGKETSLLGWASSQIIAANWPESLDRLKIFQL